MIGVEVYGERSLNAVFARISYVPPPFPLDAGHKEEGGGWTGPGGPKPPRDEKGQPHPSGNACEGLQSSWKL